PEDLTALHVERQPIQRHDLARRLVLTLTTWSKPTTRCQWRRRCVDFPKFVCANASYHFLFQWTVIQAPNSSQGLRFGKRRRKLMAVSKLLSSLCALFVLCVSAGSFPCFGQQISRSDRLAEVKIDRFVRQEMLAHRIPGVSLAVLRRGKIVLLKSYGFANVEHQVPVKPSTIFQSGSIGKQFTAAAVMILVQENKLALDDKISKYFPDAPAAWKDITIQHLLTHTSGMGDYPSEIDLQRDYTEEQYFESFKKAPLDFAPGSNWNYSNIGYATLGVLIRKVTGKYSGDFLQERIFKPLSMTTARIISEDDIVPNRAAGYRLVNGQLKT